MNRPMWLRRYSLPLALLLLCVSVIVAQEKAPSILLEGLPSVDATVVNRLRREASEGSADALYYLGILYYYGQGVAENKEEALQYFKQAASKNHVDAQSNLGQMFLNGEGTARDINAAMTWFISASNLGSGDAAWMLGRYHLQVLDFSRLLDLNYSRFGRAPTPSLFSLSPMFQH